MTEFSKKNLLKNKEMVFENGAKNIQAEAYNGARTVFFEIKICEQNSVKWSYVRHKSTHTTT